MKAATALAMMLMLQVSALPQTPVPVTVDNFVRAETDLYFSNSVKGGGFGGWHHIRELMPIDHQTVVRGNRDTLYSTRVFDLDAGPVTVTLPGMSTRFMSLQIINEDQYTTTEYGAGPHKLDKEKAGTRYALVGIRTLVDPNDPDDLGRAHVLQDAIEVAQPNGPGKFEIPDWDKASQSKVRDALLVLAGTVTDTRRAFGTKEEVDPVQYLLGAASAWGANPPRDAIYLNVVPPKNDGTTNYTLKVRDVPVDGFWSISLYNQEGYYEKNPYDAYTLNNITTNKDEDGTVTIRFGGRWQACQLPANHERLELHGPALPPPCRDTRWHMEISGGKTRELKSIGVSRRLTIAPCRRLLP